jgi:hypothetical protein
MNVNQQTKVPCHTGTRIAYKLRDFLNVRTALFVVYVAALVVVLLDTFVWRP